MIAQHLQQIDELKSFLHIVDNYVITSFTDARGFITDVSKAFCEISGYTKEELVGKPHNIVRHPDTPSKLFKEMWSTLQAGDMWEGEIKNRTKDGNFYWVVSTMFPRFDGNGNIVGYISLRQDVTADKELREKERILKVQSKNAAMGEMISMIAHQWKQPLSSISSVVTNLKVKHQIDTLDSDKLINSLDKIDEYISYLSETTSAFQNFFRPNELIHATPLSEILSYSIQLLEPRLLEKSISLEYRRGHTVITNKSDQPFYCSADEEDIELHIAKNDLVQVILNLIHNSIDALVEKHIQSPLISIKVEKFDKHLHIKIEDNGGGIHDDILEELFSPYRTSKGDQGTGIGLYMCKLIVENHLHGSITAENNNIGALFTLTIPIHPNPV